MTHEKHETKSLAKITNYTMWKRANKYFGNEIHWDMPEKASHYEFDMSYLGKPQQCKAESESMCFCDGFQKRKKHKALEEIR